MGIRSDFGNLPPNILRRKWKSDNSKIEIYTIIAAVSVIVANFSIDNLPILEKSSMFFLAIGIISVTIMAVFLLMAYGNHEISITKEISKEYENSVLMDGEKLISAIEMKPLYLESLSMRERTLIQRALSDIWKNVPEEVILISLNYNGKSLSLEKSNEAVKSYIELANSFLSNTYYFRHFLVLIKKRSDEVNGFGESLNIISGNLERIGIENTIMRSNEIEKLLGEIP
ncbi:MAG: hypothetical protein ACYCSG_01960 [Thermoplasmataceae archaeon]